MTGLALPADPILVAGTLAADFHSAYNPHPACCKKDTTGILTIAMYLIYVASCPNASRITGKTNVTLL
jgi:hypothetical protein